MTKINISSVLIMVSVLLLSTGCAVTPYEKLNLDTTSNFQLPKQGNAGIYVYQWKTGIWGAGWDVDFEIKGYPKVPLNTGEYAYFEVLPGDYEYKTMGGIFKVYIPVKFEANQNYFFHAFLLNAQDRANLIRDQVKIDEAKANILNGRYEKNLKD